MELEINKTNKPGKFRNMWKLKQCTAQYKLAQEKTTPEIKICFEMSKNEDGTFKKTSETQFK
jgi:hypothetical protein